MRTVVDGESAMRILGGIGLFLLGMRLMSDGLRIAAGPALRSLLMVATRSRLRAVAAGTLVTALVQSSSAVVLAILGFTNAGLLGLGQSVGLVLGANLGTTLTSWIVALVGFSIDLKALALPGIAAGMALWISARGRRAALGQALAGFGVFFLGLDALKGAFIGIGPGFIPDGLDAGSAGGMALFALAGTMLTVLMQSSSAALAVILTASAQGTLPLEAAAAMVVGANLGTTSTAVLATLGATAAARRAAASHVVFNLFAGALALPMLPWLLALSSRLARLFGIEDQPATELALLHTQINLLGIVAIWPLLPALVSFLERRFGAAEATDAARPRFLDRHVLGTPQLAVEAVRMELHRLAGLALGLARAALSREADADSERLAADRARLERLAEAILDFVPRIEVAGVAAIETVLPRAARVAQYLRSLARAATELAAVPDTPELPAGIQPPLLSLRALAERILSATALDAATPADTDALRPLLEAFEQGYQHAKGEILRHGSRGAVSAAVMVHLLDRISLLRRVVEQAGKAAVHMAALELDREGSPAAG